ncbi:MAG: sigma-70 family RNA polymerase sigma factor [Deltaproteobacteria bacterium]
MTTTPAMITDIELVERSRQRDADAFGALVTRHQQLVFGVALARCHDPALAEDVAQEAFVAAWRDLDRLRDGERVGSWVAGIARNLAANAVRTRARRERMPVEPVGDSPSPEAEALEREDRELLQRALGDLSETHRETLVLYYLEGHSIAQIASALGHSDDAVKQRLSRGRQALREGVVARVETVLARTRLRPGFGVGVVAALTLSTVGAKRATAGKVMMLMTAKKLVLVLVAMVVLAGGALYVTKRGGTAHAITTVAAAGSSATPPTTNRHGVKPHVERFADKAARERMLAAIRDAHTLRATTPSVPSSGTPAPALPEAPDMDREYIRGAVREIIPLLGACYEEGMQREPKLAGVVVVDFTIEGEGGVGGAVGSSTIDASASTIVDPTVRECIQETMYALQIDPPPNGGVVKVRYPFAFRPVAPEDIRGDVEYYDHPDPHQGHDK